MEPPPSHPACSLAAGLARFKVAACQPGTRSPNAPGRIHIELYALDDPAVDCIQVFSPFEVHIPIGDHT